jgi:hypothetical protein
MQKLSTLEREWRQALRGSVGTEEKEDESSTGRIWDAGFHPVMARSYVAGVLKLMNSLFLCVPIFFRAELNR